MKKYSVILAAIFWGMLISNAEPPPLTYLQPAFPAVNQHGFVQIGGPSSFGFTSPGTFATTGYTGPSKIYIPNKAYIQPKLYPVPMTKFGLQTTGFGLSREKNYEEEYRHEPTRYEFHYNVHDPHHGTKFAHKEYRDNHVAKGQYVVLLPDGRKQIVDYIADSHGYRPTIRYEGGGFDSFGYRK